MVLDRIVKEGRDCLVLGRAVLEGDARCAQEVRDVGNARALANVVGMEPGGEDEGGLEPLSRSRTYTSSRHDRHRRRHQARPSTGAAPGRKVECVDERNISMVETGYWIT
jgi:hypothetical protein